VERRGTSRVAGTWLKRGAISMNQLIQVEMPLLVIEVLQTERFKGFRLHIMSRYSRSTKDGKN